MPIYTDRVDDQIAQLSNKGRELYTRRTFGDVAFKFTGWALGRGGYDPDNVVKTLPIDPSHTILLDHIYPQSPNLNPLSETDFEAHNNRTLIFVLRVPHSTETANYGIGEIGIWGTITDSVDPAEIGQEHLMIIAHTPITCLTLQSSRVFRLLLNL